MELTAERRNVPLQKDWHVGFLKDVPLSWPVLYVHYVFHSDMLLDVTSQYIPAAFSLEGAHSRGAAKEPS